MNKLYFLLVLLAVTASSCQREIETNESLDFGDLRYGSDIRFLIAEQKGPIDADALLYDLENKSFQTVIWQATDKNTCVLTHNYNMRYLFDSDGSCRMYECNGKSPYTARTYSRDWSWKLNGSTISMTDEFGNKCIGRVVYYDGEYLCYKGGWCGELRTLSGDETFYGTTLTATFDDNYTIVKIVDDRKSWLADDMLSYEVISNHFAADNDPRAADIMLYDNTPAEIDDEAFVEKLLNGAVLLGSMTPGTATDCIYGDITIYSREWKSGQLFYHEWSDIKFVFMENNVCRQCRKYRGHDDEGAPDETYQKVYIDDCWSYDAATNVLTTSTADALNNDEWKATVIYFNDNVAILRGEIMGMKPTGVTNTSNFYYIDFEAGDRAAILEEYNVNYYELFGFSE